MHPTAGTISYNNIRLDNNHYKTIRNNTAYIPQDNNLWQGNTKQIIDEIFSYKINEDNYPKTSTINNHCEALSLNTELLDRNFEKLSGGEKQRILILISLLLNRDIYLLDEITASVDNKTKKKIIHLFSSMQSKTVIAVSHDRAWLKNNSFKRINLV